MFDSKPGDARGVPEVPLSRVRVACEPVTWVSASWTCPRRNRPQPDERGGSHGRRARRGLRVEHATAGASDGGLPPSRRGHSRWPARQEARGRGAGSPTDSVGGRLFTKRSRSMVSPSAVGCVGRRRVRRGHTPDNASTTHHRTLRRVRRGHPYEDSRYVPVVGSPTDHPRTPSPTGRRRDQVPALEGTSGERWRCAFCDTRIPD